MYDIVMELSQKKQLRLFMKYVIREYPDPFRFVYRNGYLRILMFILDLMRTVMAPSRSLIQKNSLCIFISIMLRAIGGSTSRNSIICHLNFMSRPQELSPAHQTI
jgi:hypothetical protein